MSEPSRKRKGDPSKWKRNVIKLAKVKGLGHVNYSSKSIPDKSIGPPCK